MWVVSHSSAAVKVRMCTAEMKTTFRLLHSSTVQMISSELDDASWRRRQRRREHWRRLIQPSHQCSGNYGSCLGRVQHCAFCWAHSRNGSYTKWEQEKLIVSHWLRSSVERKHVKNELTFGRVSRFRCLRQSAVWYNRMIIDYWSCTGNWWAGKTSMISRRRDLTQNSMYCLTECTLFRNYDPKKGNPNAFLIGAVVYNVVSLPISVIIYSYSNIKFSVVVWWYNIWFEVVQYCYNVYRKYCCCLVISINSSYFVFGHCFSWDADWLVLKLIRVTTANRSSYNDVAYNALWVGWLNESCN